MSSKFSIGNRIDNLSIKKINCKGPQIFHPFFTITPSILAYIKRPVTEMGVRYLKNSKKAQIRQKSGFLGR